MRTLVAVENVSLDGVMQSPGRPDEDTRGGFDRGGWAVAALMKDPEAAMASFEGQNHTEAMIFGGITYLDLVGYWLTTAEPNPFTEVIRNTPKYVASTTLTEPLPHPNSHLLTGDPVAAVAEFKEQGDGALIMLGSGMLLRDLAAAGLVDRYVLTIIPVVLGSGTRLFGDTYAPMMVEKSFVSPTGIVVVTYAVQH